MSALIEMLGFAFDLLEARFFWRFVLTVSVTAAIVWWILAAVADPLLRWLICLPTGFGGWCLSIYWQTHPGKRKALPGNT
jgi:hypothetical protein